MRAARAIGTCAAPAAQKGGSVTYEIKTTAHSQNARHMLADIDRGLICLPRFQRDYVWEVEAAAALIDSILKGYPIGALIFWRSTEELKDVRNLGRFALPAPPAGRERTYVLDGQQRLTSLYAALKGAQVTLADGRTRDFAAIVVDLGANPETEAVCTASPEGRDPARCIPLHRLFEAGPMTLAQAYPPDTHPMIEQYRNALAAYMIPYVQLENAPISVATEVFTRVNVGGKSLTVFEIMVAKTFDSARGFDLLEKWEALQAELADRDFDTVEPISLLHLIAQITVGDLRKGRILDLDKGQFIDSWAPAEHAFSLAVDFVRQHVGLRVSRLMPYTSVLVPIAYFMHLNGYRPPAPAQADVLQAYLFLAGWTSRYSGPIETNLNRDCQALAALAQGQPPAFDFAPNLDPDWLIRQEFRANEALSKTVMAVLARERPVSFETNTAVDLDNSAMKLANSKNFHHIFPKAHLRRAGSGAAELSENSVANIALVDDFLNKARIRARPPADYLAEFRARNPRFAEAMRTHLIDVDEGAPVWANDYPAFLSRRGRAIVARLEALVAPACAGAG